VKANELMFGKFITDMNELVFRVDEALGKG
jgi:hypothetical protein